MKRLTSKNVIRKFKKGDILRVKNALYLDTGQGAIPVFEQKVPGTDSAIQSNGKTYYYNSTRLNNDFVGLNSDIQEAIRQQDILHDFLNDLKSDKSNINENDWQTTYHTKSGHQPRSGIKEVVVKPKSKRFVTKKTRKEIDELVNSGKYKVVREGPYRYTGSSGKSTLTGKDLDKAIGAIIPFSNYHGVQPRPGEFVDALFKEHNLGKSIQSAVENAAFFSGPVGRFSRALLGTEGLLDPNTGVAKTVREFSNGNYVKGAASLFGDALNFSLVRPGYTRFFRHPVKTTKKVKSRFNKFDNETDDIINNNSISKSIFKSIPHVIDFTLGKEKFVNLRLPKEKLPIPFNIRSMFNYNLGKEFNQYDLLNMLNKYIATNNKSLAPQEVQEITNRWNLETKAEAAGMSVDEYKKFLKQEAEKVQRQSRQQTRPQQTNPVQQVEPLQQVVEVQPETIPVQEEAVIPEGNLVLQESPQTVAETPIVKTENISTNNTSSNGSSVSKNAPPSSTVTTVISTPTIDDEYKKLMKSEILEYLKYNNIEGLSSPGDLDKLRPNQLQSVYNQIQAIYRDYGMPHTKKENSSSSKKEEEVSDLNRSDVRDLLRYYGINPYDLTGSQRKALRKYINGDTSQDISFLNELNYTRNMDNLIAPFTIYKNKVGGKLISRNSIERFQKGKAIKKAQEVIYNTLATPIHAIFGNPGKRRGYSGGRFGGAGISGTWNNPTYSYNEIYPADTLFVPVTQTFNDAFADARRRGLNTFEFNGGTYGTELGNNPNWEAAGNARTRDAVIPVPIPADTIRKTSDFPRNDTIITDIAYRRYPVSTSNINKIFNK